MGTQTLSGVFVRRLSKFNSAASARLTAASSGALKSNSDSTTRAGGLLSRASEYQNYHLIDA